MAIWPFRQIGNAWELWRLRRKFRSVHRALITEPEGVRPETNAEYLERLRTISFERYGAQSN
jgi:hypothetical protein